MLTAYRSSSMLCIPLYFKVVCRKLCLFTNGKYVTKNVKFSTPFCALHHHLIPRKHMQYEGLRNFSSIHYCNRKDGDCITSSEASIKNRDDGQNINTDFNNESNWINSRSVRKKAPAPKPFIAFAEADHGAYDDIWRSDNTETIGKADGPPWMLPIRSVPRITTDLVVEMVAIQVRNIFQMDCYCAYQVASWLRKDYYPTQYSTLMHRPLYRAVQGGDIDDVVNTAVDSLRYLKSLQLTKEMLYQSPMLIKVPKEELQEKIPYLVMPHMFSTVQEGLPMASISKQDLARVQRSFATESRWLTKHANRVYLMADALETSVSYMCSLMLKTFGKRLVTQDLARVICGLDQIRAYRIPPREVLRALRVLCYNPNNISDKLAGLAALTNTPRVIDALHRAPLLQPRLADSVLNIGHFGGGGGGNFGGGGGHFGGGGVVSSDSTSGSAMVSSDGSSGNAMVSSGGSSGSALVSSDGSSGSSMVSSYGSSGTCGTTISTDTRTPIATNKEEVEQLEEILKEYQPPVLQMSYSTSIAYQKFLIKLDKKFQLKSETSEHR